MIKDEIIIFLLFFIIPLDDIILQISKPYYRIQGKSGFRCNFLLHILMTFSPRVEEILYEEGYF